MIKEFAVEKKQSICNKRVLFLANHFITLFSFRKELIRELVDSGCEVYVSLPESSDNSYFSDMGCKVVETPIDRRGVNLARDLKLIRFYKKLMTEIKPDIIFSYTIKPNIYGCFGNRHRFRQVCNITGTGSTFLEKNIISLICKILYRISVKKAYSVFFQNNGDLQFFIKNRMIGNNYKMLPGSGCNLDENVFSPLTNDGVTRFIFIGRVMKLKGIDEYLEAASVIRSKYPDTEFLIAGWNEEERYKQIIADYQEKGIVKYIGFRRDIKDWISKCHCTVLPSHGGEGIPNVLLESAAAGRVCIGSRINGTVDVIDEGVTGYLFEKESAESLEEQMEKFLKLSFEEKCEMGKAARCKVEKNFDRTIVIQKYIQEVENS